MHAASEDRRSTREYFEYDFIHERSRVIRRLSFCLEFYRVRDSAPDGSNPQDCALLLAMEDNLKTLNPVHISQRNFLVRSRWEYQVPVGSLSTGMSDLC